ncbi:hypothetical protein COMA1_140001 [Candidatus Nitrospira nitrosa]|uniref:Insertion element IS402-like domain-containing protein n=1 Tax=Candidatus Nitrospira nitrosa TaxID=1742972 RepID=A0A0S4LDP8_9BACT|nr:hypothetical protein COMA1_140001 [Candidatus Nitrospira nitrosa]
MDAVLWIARTGAHWRELPDSFGAWNTVFQRYNRWSNAGIWERVFRALSGDPDFEYVMIDSTIVRAHQHAAGAKGGSRDGSPWPFERRADHQNPHGCGWPGQSAPLHPVAGAGSCLYASGVIAGRISGAIRYCRQGI